MTATHTVEAEERIDVLARRLLGSELSGGLEALLKANPGLAAGGLFVPAGRVLTLPEVTPPSSVVTTVNPWD